MIQAPGYRRLVTHVFRRGGAHLDSDAVFGVRASLVADWRCTSAEAPAHAAVGDSAGQFHTIKYDFVLARL